jgi:hypothetical protein
MEVLDCFVASLLAMTNKIPFSRRDARPSYAVQRINRSAEHHRVTPEPVVGPASALSCSANKWPG